PSRGRAGRRTWCPWRSLELSPPHSWGGVAEGDGDCPPHLWGGVAEGDGDCPPHLWGGVAEGDGDCPPHLWGGVAEGDGGAVPYCSQANSLMNCANWSGLRRSSPSCRSFSGRCGMCSVVAKSSIAVST